MRIRGSNRWSGGRYVETACRKMKHRNNLLAGHMKLVNDFFDTQSGFEVFENRSNGHTGILKHPSAATPAWHAFHRGTEAGSLPYLFPITKFTVLTCPPFTVTDFSHVLGSVKIGRSTLCSVRTS